MLNQKEIVQQQGLLNKHRLTLSVYLNHLAIQGTAHVDPATIYGIQEARQQIRRIKDILRSQGIHVADHPDDVDPSTEGVPMISAETIPWPTAILNDTYYPLPGRQQQLALICDVLGNAKGARLIVIDGLGGIGKTATAVEIARRLLQLRVFEGVIGDSAKEHVFSGGDILQVRDAILDFDALLDTIARQLGHWELPTLKSAEKRSAVNRLLHERQYLILVDNLETAENAQSLVAQLTNYLHTSRAIVTSRQQVRLDFARSFTLNSLSEEDSLFFIHTDAEQRGVEQILQTSREQLIEIHHITGGAPLALKLVVAQARFFDLRLVLDQLRKAGSKLYTFIFRQSWQHLSPVAQRMLIYVGQTVVTTVSWDELQGVGIADNDEELLAAIDQLVGYSLINVSALNGTMRYGIHQLTRQFVNSSLPELWREQGLYE